MNTSIPYAVIVLGGGKGGKTLATELGSKGVKRALIERSAEMIGGTCINVACIPTKTLIASARALKRRGGQVTLAFELVMSRWIGPPFAAGLRAWCPRCAR
jgi:pyruvate/2-oxoglutarate dehydrogenase complex dihydrolipoamide dehydrogenase (E3) component